MHNALEPQNLEKYILSCHNKCPKRLFIDICNTKVKKKPKENLKCGKKPCYRKVLKLKNIEKKKKSIKERKVLNVGVLICDNSILFLENFHPIFRQLSNTVLRHTKKFLLCIHRNFFEENSSHAAISVPLTSINLDRKSNYDQVAWQNLDNILSKFCQAT